MRVFLFVTFLILFSSKEGNAQTNVYHPMPDSNASWCESATWGFCPAVDKYILSLEGDTIINSLSYHKLYAGGNVTCQQFPASFYSQDYRGAFREDTAQKKVYFIEESQINEILLYDFSLGIGDTIPAVVFTSVITGIDSALVGGNYRKRFLTNGYFMNGYLNVVEGVGSNFGLYQILYLGIEYGSILHTYSENFMEVFVLDASGCSVMLTQDEQQEELKLEIYPNPSSDAITIEFGQEITHGKIEIQDMLGNVVFSQLIVNRSTVTCENLPVGMFIVTIVDQNSKTFNKKIVRCP